MQNAESGCSKESLRLDQHVSATIEDNGHIRTKGGPVGARVQIEHVQV